MKKIKYLNMFNLGLLAVFASGIVFIFMDVIKHTITPGNFGFGLVFCLVSAKFYEVLNKNVN